MRSSAAVKLMLRVRETGSVAPGRIGGHRPPVLEPHQDLLRSIVPARSAITLAEIQGKLRARAGRLDPLGHPPRLRRHRHAQKHMARPDGDYEDYQLLKRKLLADRGLPRRATRMAGP